MNKEVIFYYDIVCPYSYVAACRIENVVKNTNAKLTWKPVLLGTKILNFESLGGIYKSIKAPQGKDGSASDIMPENKKVIYAKDLIRTMQRFDILLMT